MAIIHGFHFSDGNAKMGKHVGNFSVLGKITCPYNVPCRKDCYMNGIRDYRKSVHEAYSDNTKLLMIEKKYDEFVDAACYFIWEGNYTMFRWNVDGDFFSLDYLKACCDVAKRNPKVKFMAFTKQYAIAEQALEMGIVPKNFNIVFSAWNEYKPDDVSKVPVAYYDDGEHKDLIDGKPFVCKDGCNQQEVLESETREGSYFQKALKQNNQKRGGRNTIFFLLLLNLTIKIIVMI